MRRAVASLSVLVAVVMLAGCAVLPGGGEDETPEVIDQLGLAAPEDAEPVDDGDDAAGMQPPLQVNAFLWRASLDTLDFMPLRQPDPDAGVITTDWHNPEADSDERFRLNVHVRTEALRADGLRVRVFRQVRQDGQWAQAAATPEVARGIEDAILARARKLRLVHGDRFTQ